MPARLLFAPVGRAIALVLLMAAVCSVAGCSQSDRVKVHPVEGQLSWNGQPLANAFVILHPVDKSDPRVLSARAQTDAAGKFQLTTYENGDGAAAGEYKVTVEYYQLKQNGSSFEPGPNVMPDKIARPDLTDIKVRVAEGKNTLEPISLR